MLTPHRFKVRLALDASLRSGHTNNMTTSTHIDTQIATTTLRQRIRAQREERALLRLVGQAGRGTWRDELIDMNESVRA